MPSVFSVLTDRTGLNLDEVLAAAEMILGGTEEIKESKRELRSKRKTKSSKQRKAKKRRKVQTHDTDGLLCQHLFIATCDIIDEAYNSTNNTSESETEFTDDIDSSLADSGYSGNSSSPLSHESRYVRVSVCVCLEQKAFRFLCITLFYETVM